MAIDTSPVKAVAVFPNWSRAVTTTGGWIWLLTITSLGWAVKTNCDAAAGFTVTLGCAAMVTEPTLAVMFFAPATVELNVPCISPFRSEEHTSELQSRGHLVCRILI